MTTPVAAGPHPFSVYTGRATNWPMTVITSVAQAVLILALALSGRGSWTWAIAVPLLLAALAVVVNLLTAFSVRTTTGPNGVTVHWGALGWPRSRYPAGIIQRAEVIDLPWWSVSWGFWWTPRRTCCTVGSGPALRLSLTSGRSVTISVPDPSAAVSALTPNLPGPEADA